MLDADVLLNTDEVQLNDLRVKELRRKEFQRHLTYTMDLVTYSLIVLLYIADESIIRAAARCLIQMIVTNPFAQKMNPLFEDGLLQRVIARKQLHLMFVINGGCIILHLFMGSTSVSDPGVANITDYSYGSLTLNVIGERRFRHWFNEYCYVLALDVVIFVLQYLTFCVEYVYSQNYLTEEETQELNELAEQASLDKPEQEFDGYMGNVTVYQISPVKVWSVVSNFSKMDEVEEEQQPATA